MLANDSFDRTFIGDDNASVDRSFALSTSIECKLGELLCIEDSPALDLEGDRIELDLRPRSDSMSLCAILERGLAPLCMHSLKRLSNFENNK